MNGAGKNPKRMESYPSLLLSLLVFWPAARQELRNRKARIVESIKALGQSGSVGEALIVPLSRLYLIWAIVSFLPLIVALVLTLNAFFTKDTEYLSVAALCVAAHIAMSAWWEKHERAIWKSVDRMLGR